MRSTISISYPSDSKTIKTILASKRDGISDSKLFMSYLDLAVQSLEQLSFWDYTEPKTNNVLEWEKFIKAESKDTLSRVLKQRRLVNELIEEKLFV